MFILTQTKKKQTYKRKCIKKKKGKKHENENSINQNESNNEAKCSVVINVLAFYPIKMVTQTKYLDINCKQAHTNHIKN